MVKAGLLDSDGADECAMVVETCLELVREGALSPAQMDAIFRRLADDKVAEYRDSRLGHSA
jgi:Xaa-Pro aminopeptidase